MNQDQAVKALNEMAFKPGWRVLAEPFGPRKVLLMMNIDTVDTSYPDPDGQCRRRTQLYRERLFDPEGLDLEGVCYQVLKLATDTDVHEDREFLKVRRADGSWYAPLHPHTMEGELSWKVNQLIDSRQPKRLYS